MNFGSSNLALASAFDYEAGRMLLHPAVQRGLVGAEALHVDEGHHPSFAGAAKRWLASEAHKVVSLDGLGLREEPQSLTVPPVCRVQPAVTPSG